MGEGRGGASVRAALLLSRSRYGINRGGLGGPDGEISPNAGSPCVIHFGVLEIATVRNSAAAAAAEQRVLEQAPPTTPPPCPRFSKAPLKPLKV